TILIGRSGHCAWAGWELMNAVASPARKTTTRLIGPPPSCDLLGLAQAFEQCGAQQELARQRGIVGLAPQLVVVALPHRRIALLQQPLVADGLRLRVRNGDMPPLPLIAIKLRL